MLEEEVMISEITANVIISQLEVMKTWLSGNIKDFWVKNLQSFNRYLTKTYEKNKMTKTLLYKDKAVNISDIYINIDLSIKNKSKVIKDTEVLDKIEAGKKILITASAGSGKSFFAKFLFLSCIARKNIIPIMIELRNVVDLCESIISIITTELQDGGIKISLSQTEELVNTCKFLIILDGYDEVPAKQLETLNSNIMQFTSRNTSCPLIITSRPDERLEYFSLFEIYKIKPLNLDQAVKLINKIDYHEDVKQKFLLKLKSGKFNKQSDFISNPLLLSILLMTFEEFADVPDKMHIFYEDAFDTLYYRHDVSKGMFRREVRSKLAIDDFKSILSCISSSGYVRGKLNYSNTELIEYIRKAKKITGINNLSPEKYKFDLLTTVSLFIQDGLRYTYSHRTFQEYFAALFIINFSFENKIKLYYKYIERGSWDSALLLAFEMNRDTVETEFILPELEKVLNKYESDPLGLLEHWFINISFKWIKLENGKYKQSYRIVPRKTNYGFTLFIEEAYPKDKIKGALSYHRLLTKKRFKVIFPNYKDNRFISFRNLKEIDKKILKDTGILESTIYRIEHMKLVLKHIKQRHKHRSISNIENWL
ncbi:MAG: hypothetical protein OCD02_10190 [Spirochaetaceae bacterium]